MVALAANRKTEKRIRNGDQYWDWQLSTGTMYHGAFAGLDPATGKTRPMALGVPGLLAGGRAQVRNQISEATADELVRVEEGCHRWANGDAIANTDRYQPCYAGDDQTVYLSSANNTRPFAGLVNDVDAYGVWVTSSLQLSALFATFQQDVTSNYGYIVLPGDDGWFEIDGTPLAAFADGASATPGLSFNDSELAGIRYNNHATPDPITRSFLWPRDLDPTVAMTATVLGGKTGATLADATTFDLGLYAVADAELWDSDADFGGTTAAWTGDAAAKTMQSAALALAANSAPSTYPAFGTITLQPTDGTLGTDDCVIAAVEIRYTKKEIA